MTEHHPDLTRARKKAMDYLARREHGRAELSRKLESAGFDVELVSAVVRQLIDDGLQSDRRFVEGFIRSRINQGKGPVRIHAELGERGVAARLIDEVLDDCGQDWSAMAREIRVKKFGRALPDGFEERARQMRFLQYRGFEPGQIRSAVSAYDE